MRNFDNANQRQSFSEFVYLGVGAVLDIAIGSKTDTWMEEHRILQVLFIDDSSIIFVLFDQSAKNEAKFLSISFFHRAICGTKWYAATRTNIRDLME